MSNVTGTLVTGNSSGADPDVPDPYHFSGSGSVSKVGLDLVS